MQATQCPVSHPWQSDTELPSYPDQSLAAIASARASWQYTTAAPPEHRTSIEHSLSSDSFPLFYN